MAVAALTVSIVALLVAGGSAWYTRDQARAAREQAAHAKRSADIDTDRRVDELEAQRRTALEAKRANLRLLLHREDNRHGSIDESAFLHAIVITNEGPAEARDVELEIVSAWNNPLGTRARFPNGERRHRVGRLPVGHREVLRLVDDPSVDYGDIGECEVRWRDGGTDDLQRVMRPARPDWV